MPSRATRASVPHKGAGTPQGAQRLARGSLLLARGAFWRKGAARSGLLLARGGLASMTEASSKTEPRGKFFKPRRDYELW